jgi:hypothetical protein
MADITETKFQSGDWHHLWEMQMQQLTGPQFGGNVVSFNE